MRVHTKTIVTTIIIAIVSLTIAPQIACADAPTIAWRVVKKFPHDPRAFTQGLVFVGGHLLEGTGLHGQSRIYEREIASPAVLRSHALPPAYFGEGVTVAADRVFQLTWREHVVFVYDRALHPLAARAYAGEGWGLTYDGAHLIASDGSASLRVFDLDFHLLRTIRVHDGDRAVTQLNELEWARGKIYANVWHSNRIAVIDPASGAVAAWLDLAALRGMLGAPTGCTGEDVLNGIAYDPARDRFYVTGKCWPALFEIEVGADRE